MQGAVLLQVQSANGNISLERVAEAGHNNPLLMFQLYVFKDREFTSKVIKSEPKTDRFPG